MKVGNTPLIELKKVNPNPDHVKIWGKCEFMNPTLSIKDRMVTYILDEAEKSGKLQPGGTVVSASSGNTGASVVRICAIRGYKSIIITNKKCSQEKINFLKAHAAQVIVTESGVPIEDPRHYQNIENELCRKNPNYFGINQYNNPLNPECYYKTLGPEIWEETNGKITHLVAAGSTGGTVSGTAKFLKEKNPEIKIICPDPVGSIFHQFWKNEDIIKPKSFLIEGVGKDNIPSAMNFHIIDSMPQITDMNSIEMCHQLASKEGLFLGGSSGLNVYAAIELAKQETKEAHIVVILPDSGFKYFSKIYNPKWLKENEISIENKSFLVEEKEEVGESL